MGCFVRPGLVAVADISATLRVRFPFRVPREVGLFHARVRVRAAAALHVRRLGRHRRRRREHGRRGRRRAHRGTCSSCASTGRPSSSLSSSSPSESVGGGAAAATRAPCQSPTRRSRLPSRASARSSAAAAARARAARAAAARAGARAGRPSARRRRCPLRRFRSVFLLARFGEIWSLEMEDACRVCPRAYLLRLLRVSVQFFAIAAHRGNPVHGIEVSPIMVDFRSSFVCLGCSFLLLVARWWRVFGKFGRWRWKTLVECAHAPICCGCYVFVFIPPPNRRAPSPWH